MSHRQAELWSALGLVIFGGGLILIGSVGIGAMMIDFVKRLWRRIRR